MRDIRVPGAPRISQYLTAVLLLSTVVVFFQNLSMGLAYLAAVLAILVPLHFFPISQRYYYTLLLAAGTIWLTHLIRPIVLVSQPEGFLYPRIVSVEAPAVRSALLTIAGMAFTTLSGLVVGFRIFGRRAPNFDAQPEGPVRSILLRLRAILNVVLVLAVAFKAMLLLVFGVGFRSGAPDPILSILARFLPDFVIYGVLVLYLFKYRHQIGWRERLLHGAILGGMGVLGLLQGSKAFLVQILLALFVFYLAFRGDFRIRVRRAMVLAILGVTALVMSFPLAMSLRRYVQDNGYDMGAVYAAASGVAEVIQPEQAGFLAEWVTSRFMGFDGVLATEAKLPPEFVQVFALSNTLNRVQGRLVPLNQGAGSVSSGQAVSTYLIGHPEELRHSGSLGLFAASQVMGGPVGGLAIVFFFGMGWALYFSLTEWIRSSDARFLLRYIGVNGIIFWILSGNADYLVPVLAVSIAEVLFLAVFLRHAIQALR